MPAGDSSMCSIRERCPCPRVPKDGRKARELFRLACFRDSESIAARHRLGERPEKPRVPEIEPHPEGKSDGHQLFRERPAGKAGPITKSASSQGTQARPAPALIPAARRAPLTPQIRCEAPDRGGGEALPSEAALAAFRPVRAPDGERETMPATEPPAAPAEERPMTPTDPDNMDLAIRLVDKEAGPCGVRVLGSTYNSSELQKAVRANGGSLTVSVYICPDDLSAIRAHLPSGPPLRLVARSGLAKAPTLRDRIADIREAVRRLPPPDRSGTRSRTSELHLVPPRATKKGKPD